MIGARRHFIIHYGCYGHAGENWFPWLQTELERRGHRVTIPALPTPEGQNLANYLQIYPRLVQAVDGDTVFIGHSLGCAFTLRLLERPGASVRATVLAAGFLHRLGIPRFDPLIESFVRDPFDFEIIRRRAGAVHVFQGTDDPYVPDDEGEALAAALHAPLSRVRRGGHLNAEAGMQRFPALLDALLHL